MSEIEAGRELDARVAEKVMGWTGRMMVRKGRSGKTAVNPQIAFRNSPNGKDLGEYEVHWTEDGTKLYCGRPFAPKFAPAFSTGIEAAWQVVEQMRSLGFQYEISDGERGSFCSFVSIEDRHRADCYEDLRGLHDQKAVIADTAPLAICLAALKAVEAIQ